MWCWPNMSHLLSELGSKDSRIYWESGKNQDRTTSALTGMLYQKVEVGIGCKDSSFRALNLSLAWKSQGCAYAKKKNSFDLFGYALYIESEFLEVKK